MVRALAPGVANFFAMHRHLDKLQCSSELQHP